MNREPPMRLALAVLAMLSVSSCHPTPSEIWVPGEGYSESLSIEPTGTSVRVGQWLDLEAERRTGPWIRVPRGEELPAGNCWWRSPPPVVERDVGANVRWFAEPAGEFNLPTPADGFSRRVRFERAGLYKIRAQSAGCPGPFDSAEITVRVLP